MTDFSDFKAQIAEYANRQDWPDALVTGFIRQASRSSTPSCASTG